MSVGHTEASVAGQRGLAGSEGRTGGDGQATVASAGLSAFTGGEVGSWKA